MANVSFLTLRSSKLRRIGGMTDEYCVRVLVFRFSSRLIYYWQIGRTTAAQSHIRWATTKFENRNAYHTVPLTHVLNNIIVSETAIYEVRIQHFVIGAQFAYLTSTAPAGSIVWVHSILKYGFCLRNPKIDWWSVTSLFPPTRLSFVVCDTNVR